MILVFHDIGEGDPLSLKKEHFRDLIYFLKETMGFASPSDFEKDENKILITFDDGFEGVYKNGIKIMEELRLKGIIFIVTELVGKKSLWDKNYGNTKRIMTWEQIREMESLGFLFWSHTAYHVDLTRLNRDELLCQLKKSKDTLEEKLNHEVPGIAYPYYRVDWRVKEMAFISGYKLGFGGIRGGESRLNLKRFPVYKFTKGSDIEQFKKKGRINWKHRITLLGSRINPIFKPHVRQCFT